MDENYKKIDVVMPRDEVVDKISKGEVQRSASQGFAYADENFVTKHTAGLFLVAGIFVLLIFSGHITGLYFFWVAICTYLVLCFKNKKIGPWSNRWGGHAIVIVGKRAQVYSAIFFFVFILMFVLFSTNVLTLFYVPTESFRISINYVSLLVAIPLGWFYSYWFFRVSKEDQNLAVKNYGAKVIGKQ
jgi:hypothetical protein